MLLEPPSLLPREKRIAVIARSPALNALLRGLLRQWRYTLLEEPGADDTLLIEEGCLAPPGHSELLWLTRSRYEGSQRLSLPLELAELWQKLESRHHKPPRNHIRIFLELPAVAHIRGEATPVTINNLSDLGARFDFPRELVRGEQLRLQTVFDGEELLLEGSLIYALTRGEEAGTVQAEAGMILDRTPPVTRQRVRELIICRCLELARREIPEELFCQGLEFLQLPAEVLRRLSCPEAAG